MSPVEVEAFDGIEPRVARVLRLILEIVGGDFAARAPISDARDGLDAIAVGLHMLAESFERERKLRRQAEALLDDIVDAYDHSPGLNCSVDAADWRVLQCNAVFEQAVGAARAEIAGRSVLELFASRDDLERALVAASGGALPTPGDFELRSSGGATLTVALQVTVARDEAGKPLRLRLLFRDVTAERRLEARLLQAQKMESVGQLAGGVAHDFNNLLTVILSGLDHAATATAAEQRRDLDLVRQAAQQATDLTRQLLVFSRHKGTRPDHIPVTDRVEALRPILERTLGPEIVLEVRATSESAVRIDPSRLEQIVLNLVLNAGDAMNGRGRVALAVDDVELDAADPGRPAELRPGRWVRISVRDTGPGIAPDVLSRIFEPFFTTKSGNHGTGLGLTIVYGIARDAGGAVDVRTELGAGTEVVVFLPPSSPEKRDTAAPPLTTPRTVSVLLVDDDVRVRAMLEIILADAGFRVTAAGSAEEALELVDGGVLFDIVVSDVAMPGMDGRALLAALRARRPEQRVLLISGFADDRSLGDVAFLEKPFWPDDLVAELRRLLATGARPSATRR